MDELIAISAVDSCEHVTSIAEFYFLAGPEWSDFLEVFHLVIVDAQVNES